MCWTKIKTTTMAVLFLAAAAALGLGLWSRPRAVAEPNEKKAEQVAAKPAEEPKAASRKAEVERPLGTWERDVAGVYRIVVRCEADHLFVRATVREDKETLTFVGEADYSLTKDAILYGIITALEVPEDPDTEIECAEFLDHAFSLRYRVDGDVLTIKDVKFDLLGQGKNEKEELAVLVGRYKRKVGGEREEQLSERRPPAPARRKSRGVKCAPCAPEPAPAPLVAPPLPLGVPVGLPYR